MSDLKMLTYALIDGYIDNWLWLDATLTPDQQQNRPYENAPITIDGTNYHWRYRRSLSDHGITGIGTAYVQLVASEPITVQATRLGVISVGLWGGTPADHGPLTLDPGDHHLIVQVHGFAALRVIGNATVQIPTEADRVDRRQKYERVLDLASLDRDIYADNAPITVTWDAALSERLNVWAQLKHDDGRTFAEARKMIDPDDRTISLGHSHNLPTGDYHVLLTPQPDEYFNTLHYQHRLPFSVIQGKHSPAHYGDNATRCVEALRHAAQVDGLIGAKAKLLLGEVETIDHTLISDALRKCKNGDNLTWILLIGLADHLPEAVRDELNQVEPLNGGFLTEVGLHLSDQHTAAKAIEEHLLQLGKRGFTFDTDSFEEMLVGLVHLVDHSRAETLSELAAITLDKLLFTLALNTHAGTVSNAFAPSDTVPNGRSHPLSGVSRLLWGTGSWNEHLAAVVALAASSNYEIPAPIQAIAIDSREMTSHEWHRAPSVDAHRTIHRTPNHVLSTNNAQWNAILSADAIITVNQPSTATVPGYWLESGSTPHIGQHDDVLIALYQPPSNSRLPYTHAYFPLWAFDEHHMQDNWWFARVEDGYLALTASNALTLITHGPSAHRELRAADGDCAWVCHMGQAAVDGSFADFQSKILSLDVDITPGEVGLTPLRGDHVRLTDTRPLTINGELRPQPELHYSSPYSQTAFDAQTMDIQYSDYIMRLDFSVEEEKTL
jgi:hypothetical protein